MYVVKIGGSVYENIEKIVSDLPKNNRLIIVHGGAKIVTDIAERLGIKQKFVVSPSGIKSRYTDWKTMEIFQMVIAGKINKDIVRFLVKNGRKAIGLCGIDNSLITGIRKKKLIIVENNRKKLIEGGYTGKIKNIDIDFLRLLVNQGIIPVIGSVALSEEYEPLNINADTLASFIASKIGCEEIIFLTDVDGVLDKDRKMIPVIHTSEIQNMNIGFGMKRKLLEISRFRIPKAYIYNGLRPRPFSDPVGTVIIYDGN
ncbi:MAG: [LysW]-aminoadipate/[LysW]-glutamate kinase [Thermoproteales archaeon]|nr:[LysW]-aminoadipate/[LysW]-glutamate kinase [Thermoproteales archaeon]